MAGARRQQLTAKSSLYVFRKHICTVLQNVDDSQLSFAIHHVTPRTVRTATLQPHNPDKADSPNTRCTSHLRCREVNPAEFVASLEVKTKEKYTLTMY